MRASRWVIHGTMMGGLLGLWEIPDNPDLRPAIELSFQGPNQALSVAEVYGENGSVRSNTGEGRIRARYRVALTLPLCGWASLIAEGGLSRDRVIVAGKPGWEGSRAVVRSWATRAALKLYL